MKEVVEIANISDIKRLFIDFFHYVYFDFQMPS